MVTFKINHSMKLNCTNKNLLSFQLYATDNEQEIAELRELQAKFKACEEIVPEKKEKKESKGSGAGSGSQVPIANTVDPTDDITLVKGVGKKTAEKLAEAGITTKSGLKKAVTEDREKVVAALDEMQVTNIEKFFEEEAK